MTISPISNQKGIPQSLKTDAFSNLKILSLSNLGLKEFPESVCGLNQLVILNIMGNKMTNLPESIGNLRNLREFLAGDNRIENNFNFGRNSFETLPPSIENWTKIEKLWLCDCGVHSLPLDSMKKLVNLKQLLLHDNPLDNFPRYVLLGMKNLKLFTLGIVYSKYQSLNK